jgi:hypothetical protein
MKPSEKKERVFWEAEQPVVVFKQVEGPYEMHRIDRTASTVADLRAWTISANQRTRPTPTADKLVRFRSAPRPYTPYRSW